ncbi:hypothetical protein ACULTK_002822 [Yersinia enterocolitica]|uniref:hypothetical protein n=1 Tax=Yersinia enterocolitica TaxID=630 RepID=UPI003AB4E23F
MSIILSLVRSSRTACVEVVGLMIRCLLVAAHQQLRRSDVQSPLATFLSCTPSRRCYTHMGATQDSRAG